MMPTSKRLHKEASQAAAQSDESVVLKPKDNIFEWEATIRGPSDSFYEGYSFDLIIHVPTEYPMIPPVIKFKTKIFHPNVLFEVQRFGSLAKLLLPRTHAQTIFVH
ncbi:hypothetical protein EON63_09685 [archaeon]|nr:MAG: hypothetical protein EON63_09685 [archaeon]